MTLPQPDTSDTDPIDAGKLSGTDTIVSYPRGDTGNTGVVLHREALSPAADGGQRWAVLLDTTSCHPVDAAWPDQGADRAVLQPAASADPSQARPVLDCVVAATDGTLLLLGGDIPVRPGTPGWAFVVAHIVEDVSGLAEGERVELVVDAEYRRALSLGHSGCHLAALALNRAVAGRWSKEVRADGLGSPDFDGIAIESSRIGEFGSVDTYRLNKSLRRKGFDAEGLADALPEIGAAINATLAEWTGGPGGIHIDAEGPRLSDRRHWVCELPDGTVRIPCGGTHARSLAELGAVTVALELADIDGTPVLTMRTTVGA
ncbi:alanyl-tRNA synthetase [Microterricola gilva]|uniref:Alanyl-tRNA synthetase n=1 Tax=Microterricola gilva TaxID=393267 RepID=A0A4V2GAY6_9MICO|nr:metal-dependent hydrolase [Microterricola gilva]RZU66086.1 alanyl-tRNA synthetase [Microterricola gilva]